MQVLCVNDLYSVDTLEFYKEYGVIHPLNKKIYTVRGVIRNHTKPQAGENVGLLLDEIHNPKVPVINPILGEILMEPNFSVKRFRNLDMSEITVEQIRIEISLIEANKILNNE
jgi:hypothetical protein